MNTALPHKTTVSELRSGDIFSYRPHASQAGRLTPVESVESIGGRPLADGSASFYPEGMHRVRYTDSDQLGTLFYGTEVVYRAKR